MADPVPTAVQIAVMLEQLAREIMFSEPTEAQRQAWAVQLDRGAMVARALAAVAERPPLPAAPAIAPQDPTPEMLRAGEAAVTAAIAAAQFAGRPLSARDVADAAIRAALAPAAAEGVQHGV
jgi:hypothetical protein